MKGSAFNPSVQHEDVPGKVVASLDRISHALRTLLWLEGKTAGLSPIQIQLLVYLRFHDPAGARVGDLAREFDMTAATISEALSTLVAKQLLTKEPDPTDGRARVLRLTPEGVRAAAALSDWASAVHAAIADTPDEKGVLVLQFLMDLIKNLQEAGIITVARMCTTCRHFEAADKQSSSAYCRLLDQSLQPASLRVDCPEHEALNPV